MTMTRDQLRAARMLLHLRQEALAELAEIGTATIKRFETGAAIRPALVAKLCSVLQLEGAVLIDGDHPLEASVGAGVALRPEADLPERTRARIAAGAERHARRNAASQDVPGPKRRPGRPRKRVD